MFIRVKRSIQNGTTYESLQIVESGRIKAIFPLKRDEVEVIYHLFPFLFHFLFIFCQRFKILTNED